MTTTNLPAVQEKARTLRDYMNQDQIKGQLELALPQWLNVERFLRIVFGATLRNPALLDCTKESLLQSVMTCAQLGLEPILGRAHLIPYKNNKQIGGQWQKVLECQFQPGYQGLVDLARRSGEVQDLRSRVVYENDIFDLDYGSEILIHKPHLFSKPGDPIGAYTKWVLKGGIVGFEFMPLHEIHARRARSQSYQYAIANPKNENAQKCPWLEWPGEMMKKTALKNHTKILPASIEYLEAVQIDNRVDIIGADRQITTGYGAPAITLPEATLLTADDFDQAFADEIKNKDFIHWLDLAKEDGEDLEAVKIQMINDKRGPDYIRKHWLDYQKANPPKKPEKKTTKAKDTKKKGGQGGNDADKKNKKTENTQEQAQKEAQGEYLALQQSSDWQEMTLIFESNQELYKKYYGKDVRDFDGAAEFLKLVYADPDYKDSMPGA